MSSPNVSTHPSGRSLSGSRITALEDGEVFVFGSNAAGKHRGGAARIAVDRFGAVYGEGHGLHGQSYAIDTMSGLGVIESEVQSFLGFAWQHPELTFLVTELGTGIAGYKSHQIAPLFAGAPENVALPEGFVRIELDIYSAAWTAELHQWAIAFVSLDAELQPTATVVSARWREEEPLWDVHDTAGTVAKLRALSDDPQGAAVLSRYLVNPSQVHAGWVGILLVRALFEQGLDKDALNLTRELRFGGQGCDWWHVQIVDLIEGRLAVQRGQLREALERFSRVMWGPFVGNPEWDPDLVLHALCEIEALDTSWLGGDDLPPSSPWGLARPVARRTLLARLILTAAGRVAPWRGSWYDAQYESRLLDLAGPRYAHLASATSPT